MDCLYTTTTNYNYEEYKRFSWNLMLKRSRIVWFIVLELWILLLGCLMKNSLLIVFAVIYPIMIFLLQNRQIKKVWKSNKVAQDMLVNFEFYDTYDGKKQEPIIHSAKGMEIFINPAPSKDYSIDVAYYDSEGNKYE